MDEPIKFRKKPIVIEAMQFTDKNLAELQKWCESDCWISKSNGLYYCTLLKSDSGHAYVDFTIGMWMIKGVEGEFYPCYDDIFLATYEEFK